MGFIAEPGALMDGEQYIGSGGCCYAVQYSYNLSV